jgi:hypothetical protein
MLLFELKRGEYPVCAREPSDLRVVKGYDYARFGIRVEEDSLLSVAEKKKKKFTMPPRRERKSLDPKDREVRRRGRQVANPEMES